MITEKTLSNGIMIPNIGMGTDKIRDGEDVYNLVKSSIINGYRLFDTAELYHNETGIGKAIQDCIKENIVKREDLFIITKAPFYAPGYSNTYKGCLDSLKRLNLDYIDMYLIHHPYRNSLFWEREILDIWLAMETLYKEGKTRAIGTCNFWCQHINYLMKEANIKPMVNQIEFHPMYQQRNVVECCKKNGIVLQSWGTLNQGRIFNHEIFNKIGAKYNKNAAQVAIRYAIQNDFIPLIRTQNPQRQKENLQVFDFSLSNEDMHKLDSLQGGEFSNNHAEIPITEQKQQNYTYIEYKLFNLIPILKIKYHPNKIKFFLFTFIPVLKIHKRR